MTSKSERRAADLNKRREWLEPKLSIEEIQQRLRDGRVGHHDKTVLRQILRDRGLEPEDR